MGSHVKPPPPEPSALLTRERLVTIAVKGRPFAVLLDLSAITQKRRQKFEQSQKAEDASERERGLIAYVVKIVRTWNLTDADGEPLPVSKAGAARVSYDGLLAIVAASHQAGQGGQERGRLSAGEWRMRRLTRALSGQPGGSFDTDYILLAVARELGIPWHQVDAVPSHIVAAAWQNCQAREAAQFEIMARMRGL